MAERALSDDERSRYSRHILLPEVGAQGQAKLKAARVLVIGAGGLGSPVSLYLAGAGVGTIGLAEFDVVDRSNLQRQILFSDADVGRSKLAAAAVRLRAFAPTVVIQEIDERISATNAEAILKNYDVIVDGTDNFQTRYLVNDACVLLGKPNIHGSVYRFDGQASVFGLENGPCYRCLFPEPPPMDQMPNCSEGGVLGVLPGIIGMVQATETLKLILGIGETLSGRLLTYDALAMRFEEFKIGKDAECVVCGTAPSIRSLADSDLGISQACAVPVMTERSCETSTAELAALRKSGVKFQLVDVRSLGEVQICQISGSIHISLDLLANRFRDLAENDPIVVYCKSGARSNKAAKLLTEAGFTKVSSLRGGILQWIADIDSSLPKY